MQPKIKCLIVDDEPAAHYILESYIGLVDCLELQGHSYSATETLNFLYKQPVGLLFLDIRMPILTGLDLLKMLASPPAVIITTGYTEYALESYQYGVIDYLLKPVEFARFLKAVDRFMLKHARMPAIPGISQTPAKSVSIKVDKEVVDLPVDEILYAQSLGNYVKLFTVKKHYICNSTTADIERLLPPASFMRIHKSYIISLSRVEKFNFDIVVVNNSALPVGITYRRKLEEKLKERNFKMAI